MAIALAASVTTAHPYAKRLVKPLARLGITTVAELLAHLPARHDDLRQVLPMRDARVGQTVVFHGQLTAIANRRSFRTKLMVTEAFLRDAAGSTIRCVWFRQPYLAHTFPVGSRVAVSGTVTGDRMGSKLVSPQMEHLREVMLHSGRLVPIYPLTDGISQKQLRLLMHAALPAIAQLPETLPTNICAHERLLDYASALREVHFPTSPTMLQRARERFAFEELYMYLDRIRAARAELNAACAPRVPFDEETTRALVARLPFTLTDAQRRAAWSALCAMAGEFPSGQHHAAPAHGDGVRPMQRLLNGDVGSGKTVVAAILTANVARAGKQTAILAPTEMLALQHARSFTAWLQPLDIHVGLWTQSTRWVDGVVVTARGIASAVASGGVQVLIGTHAILAPRAAFHDLALAIIDEQHRFGVEQRAALRTKARGAGAHDSSRPWLPHLLSMTATPIPRTLALSLLGDLTVSVLDELPPGRSPVASYVVGEGERNVLIEGIHAALRSGQQVYVICPAITTDGEPTPITSVTEVFERAQRAFPSARVALLHGKLPTRELRSVMDAFAQRAVDILVTTTVVEVGVDQPNATVIVIEDADRFGLAQLHQLRGRVGRGSVPSTCFFATRSEEPGARTRLERIAALHDGFRIAELDLAERGPGAMVGATQSGFVDFRYATWDPALIRRVESALERTHASVIMSTTRDHLE